MEKKTGRKGYLFIVILVIVAAFAAGYFLFAYRYGKQQNQARQSVPASDTLALQAYPIKGSDIPFSKRYIGYVTPIHEAQVQPYISGFIEKIAVKGGEYVRKGDLLMVLQQDEYKAELASAYANILKAEANFSNAQTYYERIKKAGIKAVSPTELDNAQAQFLAAQAEFEQAKANYALAKVNYDYTIIRSPIDGIVGNVFLTIGNYVSPATGPLLSIMQYDPIRVVFSITDKEYLAEINKTKPFSDDEITLQLADGAVYNQKGQFQYTDNSLNKTTNSIGVYADFVNNGKTLVPNAYVTVWVKQMLPNALAVAKSLVLLEEDGSYVYVIRAGRIVKEKVKILASEDNKFIISDTFAQGDYLIEEPVDEKDLKKNVTVQTPQRQEDMN